MTVQTLHRACRDDDLLSVSILLDRQTVDVNGKDKHGRTALHLAAMDNNQLLAEMLFQHGADTRSTSNQGMMPLDCASEDEMTVLIAKMMARDGGYDMIKERLKSLNKPRKLKQRVAKELERVPHEKRVLPLLASLVGKRKTDLLVEASDSRRSSLSDGSKLSIADSGVSDLDRSRMDSLESVQTDYGGEIKIEKERRVTTALTKQELNTIHLNTRLRFQTDFRKQKTKKDPTRRQTHPLREHTVPKSQAKKRVTFPPDVLLDIAVANDDFVDACHIIKSRSVDINRAGPNGLTPLHRAAIEGSHECLQLLIDQGADVNLQDEHGWLPLHDAVYHGNANCVLTLIEAGTDVSAKTNEFEGLLDLADDKGLLLLIGRTIILQELGIASGIEDEVMHFFPESERESCV
ncbi:ankyrin repeat and SAM domain-containing protein 6-like [Nematostella vectensis]|uniref:ankyrin repeat and SAM domain-containing protein 6-like n=1 Tax=Nematostella vectensis TaxID=45351 RepID=UPI00139055C3|nr:ankyrin repeat and SAM domain-containing protein 6-like [Nematostella vectensis]